MNASRHNRVTQPFVLTPTELTKLCENLENLALNVEFEAKCKDNIKRKFPSLNELLKFENPPKRDILKLSLWGRSKERDLRVWLEFDKDTSSNVLISIDGSEEETIVINDLIEELLSAVKPWYGFLTKTDYTLMLLTGVLVLFLGVALAIALGIIGGTDKPSSPETVRSSIVGQLIAIAFVIAPLVFGYFLNRIRANVFPMGVFAIGQGAKRHTDKELFRTLVVVGFFVSLAASVIVSLIFLLWTA